MECPRCHKLICDCLLEDPSFSARAVGKQLSRLSGGKAGSPSTTKDGSCAGPRVQTIRPVPTTMGTWL